MRQYILNGDLWNKALKDPTPYAEWVVMQPARANEPVGVALLGNRNFASQYTLWYSSGGYFVFHRNAMAPGAQSGHRAPADALAVNSVRTQRALAPKVTDVGERGPNPTYVGSIAAHNGCRVRNCSLLCLLCAEF